MALFDAHLTKLLDFLDGKRKEGRVLETIHPGTTNWPASFRRNLVLSSDTAVELGHPKTASSSFFLWTDNMARVKPGRITIVGPDLPQVRERRIPFGRIVLLAGKDFNEKNSFDRHRELEHLRYDIHLKGYMMRAVSQYQREWSRISKEAIAEGFSFQTLGGALIDTYSMPDYIRAVEVIFITAGPDDVREVASIGAGVLKIISAMNKMASELSLDCETCEYNEVCREVAELSAMRRSLGKDRAV